MKKLLIIYPHWPPSNLAGVHRPRLISNFLPDFNWHPVVLTVKEQYYEEPHDPDLVKTVATSTEVIKTDAYPVLRLFGRRLIGDIGLRGFLQLYRAASKIIQNRQIDFVWIPIPSFYVSLVGRMLHEEFGIPYGIDYIDPWIRPLAPYQRIFSRAWWSLQIAKLLEPVAVRKASLISGVSTPYFQAVLDRNFKDKPIAHTDMPYGFDPNDHQIVLDNIDYPWPTDGSEKPFVYAGAFLPQSYRFIESLFWAVAELKNEGLWPNGAHLYFLGTGQYGGKSIVGYAQQARVADAVTEIRDRFPFLHIQQFLRSAKGVLIIGSTEKHYTASKTFQCLLSGRPIWSIFHRESSAADIMQRCKADSYLALYHDSMSATQLKSIVYTSLSDYLRQSKGWNPELQPLKAYSARMSAQKLVEAIEKP